MSSIEVTANILTTGVPSPWIDVEDYASFIAAIDAIGATERTLLIASEKAVADDKTVPSNVTLKFLQGGSLNIANTKTVTINGHVEAELYQIFKGAGSVVFGLGAVEGVHPQWWGAKGDEIADSTTAIQAAINSLPADGGTVFLPVGTYKVTSSLSFPIGKRVAGQITNIKIQGESSGLASGAATNVYGTRIDSYINGGALFDLYTSNPTCINVQFKDFECYDREATGLNYGIYGYKFLTGCVIENVGFKAFSYGIKITNEAYYSKFDRVSSFYARVDGMSITNPNMAMFRDCQCNHCESAGLRIVGSHGIFILGSWFEHNAYGIAIIGVALRGPVVLGTYFEDNSETNISIGGDDVDNFANGGLISGCYIPEDATAGLSLSLGYIKGLSVVGNTFGSYLNNRVIYSQYCEDCVFIGNKYNPAATTPLDVPAKNTIIEPQLHRGTMFSGNAAPTTETWGVGDIVWNSAPTAGNPPGWVCINRQDTQMRVQANATDTIMEVDATAGMLATDVIGITLDDGSIHWTTINAITDADTLVITVGIPAGRNAPVDADVFTNRWKAMANLEA